MPNLPIGKVSLKKNTQNADLIFLILCKVLQIKALQGLICRFD